MNKKIVNHILLGVSLFSLAGCHTANTATEATKEDHKVAVENKKVKENKEAQYVKGLEITLNKVSVAKKGGDNKHKIISVKLTAKNTTNTEVGFGSNDFIVKVNDKKISPYSKGTNFGQMIEKEKSLTGTATFELPTETKKITLFYDAGEAGTASWEISV
jgi:hypothetical protein